MEKAERERERKVDDKGGVKELRADQPQGGEGLSFLKARCQANRCQGQSLQPNLGGGHASHH